MTHPSTRPLLALAAVAAIVVGACSGAASGNGQGATGQPSNGPGAGGETFSGTIRIDGSSTVFPITQAVAEEFQIANPDMRVPVAFSGTGGGFKKFCSGETDLNDASRPIKEDDEGEGVACAAAGIEWIQLQVAIDGLTVVVNPANDFATCLTTAELAAIYGPDSPADLLWSQVRDGFPAEKVERYIPGADSGTFDYFTEEINGELDAATQFATQSEDDNTLVTGVAGSRYAIGFFGYAYYVENQDKLTALGIDAGEGAGCVEPTDATINDNSYAPLSRPLFIYPDVAKARTRPEVKGFVDFYLENTSALSAEVGYVALPDALLQAQKDAWAAAVGS